MKSSDFEINTTHARPSWAKALKMYDHHGRTLWYLSRRRKGHDAEYQHPDGTWKLYVHYYERPSDAHHVVP